MFLLFKQCTKRTRFLRERLGVLVLLTFAIKVHFAENMKVEGVTNRNSVSKAFRDRIPHCICYTCSGRNKNGFPLLKYFPNFQGFIEHCRNHDDTIPAFSFINMELDRES